MEMNPVPILRVCFIPSHHPCLDVLPLPHSSCGPTFPRRPTSNSIFLNFSFIDHFSLNP
jgi:hypothetical protein